MINQDEEHKDTWATLPEDILEMEEDNKRINKENEHAVQLWKDAITKANEIHDLPGLKEYIIELEEKRNPIEHSWVSISDGIEMLMFEIACNEEKLETRKERLSEFVNGKNNVSQ